MSERPIDARAGIVQTSGYASQPFVASDRKGGIWAAWRSWEETGERIGCARFDPESLSFRPENVSAVKVSAGPPCLAFDAQGGLWAAWSEGTGRSFSIVLCRREPSGWSSPSTVVETEDEPGLLALAAARHGLLIAWSQKRRAGRGIRVSLVEDISRPGPIESLTPEPGIHDGPCIVASRSDDPWLVWQAAALGMLGVRARSVKDLQAPGPIVDLSTTLEAGVPRAASSGPGRIWVAWHAAPSSAKDSLVRWVSVACLENGEVLFPAAPVPDMNLDSKDEDQGLEFPSILCHEDGHLTILSRSSQGFHHQEIGEKGWTQRRTVGEPGWGCRGMRIAGCVLDQGRILSLRRGKEGLLWQVLEPLGGEGSPRLEPRTSHAPTAARFQGVQSVPAQEPADLHLVSCRRASDPGGEPGSRLSLSSIGSPRVFRTGADKQRYLLLFGDIHVHSAHSDGTGTPAEWYHRAREIYHDDLSAVADHESFIGKRTGPGEWALVTRTADDWNDPGRFVTLHAFEWTGTAHPGPGHKVVYLPEGGGPVLSRNEFGPGDSARLLERARRLKAIVVPHHVGWTGADLDRHDPDVQRLWEICSCHGAYEHEGMKPIGYRKELVPGQFIRNALDAGLRFGFSGGSDGHGLNWHHGVSRKKDSHRTGLTAVFASELTRPAVLEALRSRRCYATSGAKIVLWFHIDERPMGEELITSMPVEAMIRVEASAPIREAVLISNNGVAIRIPFKKESIDTRLAIDPPAAGEWKYYYLRVIQEDDEVAWSSPIWLDSPMMA